MILYVSEDNNCYDKSYNTCTLQKGSYFINGKIYEFEKETVIPICPETLKLKMDGFEKQINEENKKK